jgi:G6PDH family F420-dependent oxidoreductase
MKIGYFLSSEEWGPQDLVAQAVKAQQAGFDGLWISDHYHPWNDEQGHSPFVWSTIGAIAHATGGKMKVTTAVTCPTIRIHPAIVAQAAATSAVMLDGNFCLGLGSGEALNEHVIGARWPEADERLEMLEEAVDVIRTLWRGGPHDYRGRHYRVEHARVYDLPERPPPIIISGFGPKSVSLVARIGDGYCTVGPDAESVRSYRDQARNGHLVQGGLKVCCGPDVDRHAETIRAYADAGFDELYINQIGSEQDAFFDAYREHILPHVR